MSNRRLFRKIILGSATVVVLLAIEPIVQQNFQSLATTYHWDLVASHLAESGAPWLLPLAKQWWFSALIGAITGMVTLEFARDWLLSPAVTETVLATEAELKLEFQGNLKLPTAAKQSNIRFWYSYYFPSIKFDLRGEDGGIVQQFGSTEQWIIFVIFQRETRYRQVVARFYCEGKPPLVQVRHNGAYWAVITLDGEAPAGQLNVYLDSEP